MHEIKRNVKISKFKQMKEYIFYLFIYLFVCFYQTIYSNACYANEYNHNKLQNDKFEKQR